MYFCALNIQTRCRSSGRRSTVLCKTKTFARPPEEFALFMQSYLFFIAILFIELRHLVSSTMPHIHGSHSIGVCVCVLLWVLDHATSIAVTVNAFARRRTHTLSNEHTLPALSTLTLLRHLILSLFSNYQRLSCRPVMRYRHFGSATQWLRIPRRHQFGIVSAAVIYA